MPRFLIAETQTNGRRFVLWHRDPWGSMTVLPWASRSRRDLQTLRRSLGEVELDALVLGAVAGLIEAGSVRHDDGQPIVLMELDDEERRDIARDIAREVRAVDDRPSGVLHKIHTEVLVHVGRHLVAMG